MSLYLKESEGNINMNQSEDFELESRRALAGYYEELSLADMREGENQPEAGEECPNCHCGTVGVDLEGANLVCRGECGVDFGCIHSNAVETDSNDPPTGHCPDCGEDIIMPG